MSGKPFGPEARPYFPMQKYQQRHAQTKHVPTEKVACPTPFPARPKSANAPQLLGRRGGAGRLGGR